MVLQWLTIHLLGFLLMSPGERLGPLFFVVYQKSRRDMNCTSCHLGARVIIYRLLVKDLHTALSLCGNSSPGPDGIPYAMLRRVSNEFLSFLLDIYNLM